MENLIRRSVPDHVLRRVLDYNYGGSIEKFIAYNDLDDEEEDPLVLSDRIRGIIAYEISQIEEEEEERRREQERLAEVDEQIRVWEEEIRPLMDRAVRYAERFPRRYSVRHGVSSTYIHGPGGTIRFSDHPRPVEDWDDEGRPIYRGGIARDEYGQYSHTHDAPEYSIDPETVAGITWQDVESMLESIAEMED